MRERRRGWEGEEEGQVRERGMMSRREGKGESGGEFVGVDCGMCDGWCW